MKRSLTEVQPDSSEDKRRGSATQRLRHCMIVQNCYPFSEIRVQREVGALVDAGHSVDVICRHLGFEPKTETIGQVTVHRINIGKKKWSRFTQFFEYLAFASKAFLKVTQLHLRNRFDVVQAHNLPDLLVFAALVPRLTGSRIILDIHDLMPEFYCSRFKNTLDGLPSYFLRWQEFLACRFAHRVITVTELWKQTLVRRGVPEEKCHVVMNLPDPAHFIRQDPETRRLARNGSQGFRILYHGTVAHRYGLDLLLKAFQLVRIEIPNATLRIHGGGDFMEDVRSLSKSLGLESHVELTAPGLTNSELSAVIQSFDVGIVPYRRDIFTDGILPTKLLEYVALGVPAVVARTSVISYYFRDDMVEFFEPENIEDLAAHICLLYRDGSRRKQIVRNADEFNFAYNWPKQKESYVRIVEQEGLRQR